MCALIVCLIFDQGYKEHVAPIKIRLGYMRARQQRWEDGV